MILHFHPRLVQQKFYHICGQQLLYYAHYALSFKDDCILENHFREKSQSRVLLELRLELRLTEVQGGEMFPRDPG